MPDLLATIMPIFGMWMLAWLFAGYQPVVRQFIGKNSVNPDRALPKVSVIIPARNEAERIRPLLASLFPNDYPDYEVIVVDDNSTDQTAEIARSYGAHVVTAGVLPADWLGKPHACWLGAQQASGELLIFLDADTSLEANGLCQMVEVWQQQKGLLSLQPYHQMQRCYERLSAFFFMLTLGSMRSFTLLRQRLKAHGCFGPCIMLDRQTYMEKGGHQLVARAILDDIELAQAMQNQGVPVHNLLGQGVISFRMYPHGVLSLIEGWSKNMASGATGAGLLFLFLLGGWISGAFFAFDLLLKTPQQGINVLLAMIPYGAYVLQLFCLLKRVGNYGWLTAILYPVSLCFFVFVFFYSCYLTLVRKKVRWKDRKIDVS